jgi:hypothetical protein
MSVEPADPSAGEVPDPDRVKEIVQAGMIL